MTKESSSRRARRSRKSTPNTQRLALGGITGAVLIAIVLCAQLVFGINLLNHEANATSTPAAETGGGNAINTPVTETGGGNTVSQPSGTLKTIPGGYDGGWFQLYFTEPINTHDESKFKGAPTENAIVALLDGAKQSIDGAFFQLNSQPITDALINAYNRGVKVRLVTDGEYGQEAPDSTFDQLETAHIPYKSDGSRGAYMHNKFFVVDATYVWTGATNFTHNGIYNDDDNAMLIRSSQLAADYTAAFEMMFAGQFSKNPVPPNPAITINGTRVEVFFSPDSNASARLAQLLQSAKTVRFMAFSFTNGLAWKDSSGTSNSIMDMLVQRVQSGQLDLAGVVEGTNKQYAKPLVCGNVNVRRDGNPDLMHHKVMIIDGSILVMGSYNYSQNAQNDNSENMLIFYNSDLVSAYLKEYDRVWGEAVQLSKSDFSCAG